MTECKIVKKRNLKVEEFLRNGPMEIDNLQSYYPTLHTLKKIPYSKWNTIILNKTLIDVVDINENIGIISTKNEDTEKIPFFLKCTPILDTTSFGINFPKLLSSFSIIRFNASNKSLSLISTFYNFW